MNESRTPVYKYLPTKFLYAQGTSSEYSPFYKYLHTKYFYPQVPSSQYSTVSVELLNEMEDRKITLFRIYFWRKLTLLCFFGMLFSAKLLEYVMLLCMDHNIFRLTGYGCVLIELFHS